jgi:hypothetical protein
VNHEAPLDEGAREIEADLELGDVNVEPKAGRSALLPLQIGSDRAPETVMIDVRACLER